jgi:hypothetical protein
MGHTLSQASTRKHPRTAFSIGGTGGSGGVGATADVTFKFDGEILTRLILEAYDNKNALTTTLSILDENGVSIYSAGALPTGSSNFAPTGGVELDGSYTLRLLQSGAGATLGTDYLTLFVR